VSTPANTNTPSRSAPAGADVDWNARWTAGDTPWEKGTPHPAIVTFAAVTPPAGRILVPGCGSGHDVRAIAAGSPSATVIGIDIAPAALAAAKAFPRTGGESYLQGDFLAGAAATLEPFDWIIEHTCFCAIPPSRRADYAAAAMAALRTGGHLAAVFFTDPENEDPTSPPFRCDEPEIDALFGRHFATVATLTGIPTHPGRENREIWRIMRKTSRSGAR
jgi:methyl halide transferase